MYQRILVATDGSEPSRKAVQHAIGLARLCAAELFVVTVTPARPGHFSHGALLLKVSDDQIQEEEKRWSKLSQDILGVALRMATDAGIKASAEVIPSDIVSTALIEAAKKHQADLIVMAHQHRTRISRMLLGSETQQVLSNSGYPLLIVR